MSKTFLEQVAEQRENLRCECCGRGETLDLRINWAEQNVRCEGCDALVNMGMLRKETGQDADGNLVDRWREWHAQLVPGELLPLPQHD